MILRLNTQQLQLMRDEARKVHPLEACAILFGKTSDREAKIKKVVTVQNILKSTTRFEINPKEFYDALMLADKDGLEFIGFFHSHPAPAYPSSIDLQFMQLWGDAIWLLLSSTLDSFAAFQVRNGKVREVAIKSDKL
jgi:proteasome lid subunit RPN8/RPN11